MRLLKITFLCSLVVMGFMFFSCTDTPVIPDSPAVSFSSQVVPILSANCTLSGCHGVDNPEKFKLLTYDDVVTNGHVKPGSAKESHIYEAITKQSWEDEAMPPSKYARIKDEDVQTIYVWIMQGAKNN